jgi:hypothetical protein
MATLLFNESLTRRRTSIVVAETASIVNEWHP